MQNKTQSVVGLEFEAGYFNTRSPCQEFFQSRTSRESDGSRRRINRGKGADKGAGTRSSLMWVNIHIIEQMGVWKPRVVIWENVKRIIRGTWYKFQYNYIEEMAWLDIETATPYWTKGLRASTGAAARFLTISILGNEKFIFDDLNKVRHRNIKEILLGRT